MMKKVLIISLVDEYHAYMKFNLFLWIFKKYQNCDITVFSQDNSLDIITESKHFLTINKAKYKELIDKLTENLKERSCVLPSIDFKTLIPQNIIKEFDSVIVYDLFNLKDLNGTILKYNFNNEWFATNNLTDCYFKRDIPLMRKYITTCELLKPTKSVYNSIKNIFGHMFNRKTYIIITREYQHKQPNTNTSKLLPHLPKFISYATSKELNIINVGFPPTHYDIISPYYHEISTDLTQGELISMFYLSDGVLLCGENGGYIVHTFCNTDMFITYPEWGSLGIFNIRKEKRKDVASVDIMSGIKTGDNEALYNTLFNHKKVAVNTFANDKSVRIIK